VKKYYKLSGVVVALGALLFMGFGCGGGDDVSTEEEEYIAGQIDPLKADISSVHEEIASLGEEIALLKTKVEGLASQEDIAKIQEDIAKIQEDIASLRGKISSLAAKVEQYKPVAPVAKEARAPRFRPAAPAAPELEEELEAAGRMLLTIPEVEIRQRFARQNLGLVNAIAGGDFASIYFLLQ
jgi:septal ring factor EnvC (AmiA/AmiB activator)